MTAPVETPSVELLTHRDTMKQVCPPWLQRGLAEKILYALALHCDIMADAIIAGVKHRFPGLYSFESLPLLGRERRIPRGRSESDAGYADRLTRFLTDHRRRGGPYAMLAQLFAYYQPNAFPIDLVYYTQGRRFHMDVDGVVTRDITGWKPDNNAAKWARWWMFFYTDQWASVPPTADELQDLKLVPRQWNAAHPFGTLILFPSTGELWGWPLGHLWGESGTWGTSGTVGFVELDSI